jgi:uncharacterized membrane protein
VKEEEETAMFCLPTHTLGTESWATAWPFLAVWIGLKLAIWAVLVAALIAGIHWLRRQPSGMAQATPLEILRARYARGELSQQEFESMRHSLERS